MNKTEQIHRCYYCRSKNTIVIKESGNGNYLEKDGYFNRCKDCGAGEAISEHEYIERVEC